jgi:hypothetical protein
MGTTQPEQDVIREIWLGNNKARTFEGKQSAIIDLDKNLLISIDHEEKTYTESSVSDAGDVMKSIEAAIGEEAENEEAKKAMEFVKGLTSSLMQMEAKVTPTGEKKKIGNWECSKYLLEVAMAMGKTSSEIWATEDIKVDFKVYRTVANIMVANQEGMMQMLKEMGKIKGIEVLTISSSQAMGAEVKSTEELLEVEEKPAPDGLYSIPAGYTKQ